MKNLVSASLLITCFFLSMSCSQYDIDITSIVGGKVLDYQLNPAPDTHGNLCFRIVNRQTQQIIPDSDEYCPSDVTIASGTDGSFTYPEIDMSLASFGNVSGDDVMAGVSNQTIGLMPVLKLVSTDENNGKEVLSDSFKYDADPNSSGKIVYSRMIFVLPAPSSSAQGN